MLAISYPTVVSPFVTPGTKTFTYDSAIVDGTTMQHAVGRLAAASTSGINATQLGFSYSPATDAETVYHSSPHSGGWYWVEEQLFPNGAPAYLTNNISGLPAINFGLDGEGRPNGAVAGGSTTLVNASGTS